MGKRHPRKSLLEDYEISIISGTGEGWEWQGGGPTRAVVKLSGDISTAMPRMSRLIEGCAYNPETHVMAFRFKDTGIVVERSKILVNKVEDEAEAQMVIDWLANIINGSDEQVMKQEV